MKRTMSKSDLEDEIQWLRDEIQDLSDRLEVEAFDSVPEDYAKRDLHHKYLAADNEAGGKIEAMERLREIIDAQDARRRND